MTYHRLPLLRQFIQTYLHWKWIQDANILAFPFYRSNITYKVLCFHWEVKIKIYHLIRQLVANVLLYSTMPPHCKIPKFLENWQMQKLVSANSISRYQGNQNYTCFSIIWRPPIMRQIYENCLHTTVTPFLSSSRQLVCILQLGFVHLYFQSMNLRPLLLHQYITWRSDQSVCCMNENTHWSHIWCSTRTSMINKLNFIWSFRYKKELPSFPSQTTLQLQRKGLVVANALFHT